MATAKVGIRIHLVDTNDVRSVMVVWLNPLKDFVFMISILLSSLSPWKSSQFDETMLICFACSFVREKFLPSSNKDGSGTLSRTFSSVRSIYHCLQCDLCIPDMFKSLTASVRYCPLYSRRGVGTAIPGELLFLPMSAYQWASNWMGVYNIAACMGIKSIGLPMDPLYTDSGSGSIILEGTVQSIPTVQHLIAWVQILHSVRLYNQL